MQWYVPKTVFATVMDKLLRAGFALGLGTVWFFSLWGFCFSSLTAGMAFGILIWLCMRRYGKHFSRRKEQQIRQKIGGELALDRLLLKSNEEALDLLLQWLPRPVIIKKKFTNGCIGEMEEQTVLVKLIVQHISVPINVQQMIEVIRESKQNQIQKTLLCLTAPLSKDASDFIHTHASNLLVIRRDELIELAGKCTPATDEDLLEIKQKKPPARSREEWTQLIFAPQRLKKYLWYGIGMFLVAILTGKPFYPAPAFLCIALYICGKIRIAVHKKQNY